MWPVEIAGERVELLPERAMHWPARGTLLVADVHLGKPAAFGAAGVPVPAGVIDADLRRLGTVIDRTQAGRLVILGDLLHAPTGRDAHTLRTFAAWRAARSELSIMLIRGNHDRSAGDPPREWGMDCRDEGEREGPFVLCHEPPGMHCAGGHVLCGHVHPCVSLRSGAGGRERARCFLIGATRTILPAFGSFTGGKVVCALASELAVLVADDGSAVMPLPGRPIAPGVSAPARRSRAVR